MNKNIISITGLFMLAMMVFVACEKDDDEETTVSKPVISNFEFGYENSGTAYQGSDLHIEATIVAEGKISTIQVTIHPEGEHGFKDEEWEVDSVFTEFSGLKNTEFHKHFDVPAHADTGHYHFHFIVTDMEGNQTDTERELEILQPEDNEPPVIAVSSAPQDGQEFTNGEVITITGTVTDNIALGGIYIGLVRVDQNLPDSLVNATNTITLLHTHDFDDPASYDFTGTIEVGAQYDNNVPPKEITGDIAWQSADYYIVIKSPDAFGGGVAFSEHFNITLNLQ